MKPSRYRPEFDKTQGYEYPAHLRQVISDLPQCPGVYFFYGDGELPLYIGKSINIRSRVLSHLRNADEVRLLRQTRRITCTPTAGEIGALLLEAQLIKAQQPLMNQKLRRNRQLYSYQINGQQPVIVSTHEVNFATQSTLFGLFRSRRSALEALIHLADEHRLCLGLLGVEGASPGKPCFRSMVNKCAGACNGKESAEAHSERLLKALEQMRLRCWPYPGAIALVEQSHDRQDFLVVRNWCYLGTASDIDSARQLDTVAAGFDVDGYKILCGVIFSDAVNIISLAD